MSAVVGVRAESAQTFSSLRNGRSSNQVARGKRRDSRSRNGARAGARQWCGVASLPSVRRYTRRLITNGGSKEDERKTFSRRAAIGRITNAVRLDGSSARADGALW